MSSFAISSIVFACAFGGALLGMFLKAILPPHHLSDESKDIVKLGMGLVGTMAALVLGLLVASAKGSYDTQSTALTHLSANVALLDRVLAHYGPETKEVRAILRVAVLRMLNQVWSKDGAQSAAVLEPSTRSEILVDQIQELAPKNERQRSLQSRVMSMLVDLGQTRYFMYTQGTTAVSVPMLIVLVLWLTAIFISFGLFAPFNATVISSLAVSGAIFLILEMYAPYGGLIQISDAPLSAALAHLGQ